MESYNLHVEKLLEMCKEGTSSAALHVLWRDTFPGRRYEIKNTLGAASVSYIVKSKCPLLNQPSYVSFVTPENRNLLAHQSPVSSFDILPARYFVA